MLDREEYLVVEDERWVVKNDDEAEWIIEKYNEKLIESARYRLSLENKIQLLQDKLNKLNDNDRTLVDMRNSYLLEYFETIDDKFKKKTKTMEKYRLPSGEIVKKYPGPEFKRTDDELVQWIKSHHLNLVEIKETPKWGELKKLTVVSGRQVVFRDTGEIIDGVEVIERPPVVEFKEG